MKKFLSLVLALVMTMSLVTISAGAKDFTDASKVTYKEAVDVMSAVKVVGGYDDGSFNPQGGLTRGAAAKIICNMILGPTTAAALHADTAPYKDVPVDHTFAGYIAYCSQQGIISGYADGTFRPAAPLTGYAFMKMLLGALGYDKAVEGYDGANWSINVAKRALNLGLNKGLVDDFNGVKNVTREEAALYAFNTLKATMVEYDQKTNISVGGAEVVIAGSKAEDVENNAAANKQYDGKADGKMQFCEKYFTKLTADKKATDAFDRPAITWKNGTKKIGTYVNTPDAEYTAPVKLGTIYSDLGLSKAQTTDNYFVDGKDTDDFTVKKGDTTNKIGGNGVLTQVWWDDSDEELIVTEINTYVGKIASVVAATSSADRYITMNGLTKPNGLNTKFETEEFAVKDLVYYTAAQNDNGGYDIQAVKALEKTATGVMTEWNGITIGDSTSNFTAGGEKYEYSAKGYIDVDGTAGVISSFKVDESELDVYCDEYGYALYVEGTEVSKDYAVVIGVGSTNAYGSETFGATLLLADGTQKTVTAKFDRGNGTASDNGNLYLTGANYSGSLTAGVDMDGTAGRKNLVTDVVGDLVTYYVNKDGDYELTMAGLNTGKTAATGKWSDAYDTAGHTQFTNGRSLFTLGTGGGMITRFATDKTIFFVATVNSSGKVVYNVYEGYKNMPSINTSAATYGVGYVTNSDYTTQLDAVFVSAASLKGLSADATFVVKQEDHTVITDSTGSYFVMPAIIDGEVTTVKVDAKNLGADTAALDNVSSIGNPAQVTSVVSMSDIVKDKNDIYTGATFNTATSSADFVDTKSYYTTTGLVAANGGVIGFGSSAKASATYWAYTDKTDFFEVSEDMKTITKVSATDLVTDANDKVFFVADEDATASWKVAKTVIVQKVKDETPSTAASITKIQVADGVTTTGYATLADAIANPIIVEDQTDYDWKITGDGDTTYKRKLNADEDTVEDDLGNFTPVAGQGKFELADGITVVKVTNTSKSKTNTATKYVAVKAESFYTVTIDNNASVAVKVTMGSQTKIVGAGAADFVFTAKVKKGSNFDVAFVTDGGATVTTTVGGLTAGTSATFGGVTSVENVDGNVKITFADPATP